MEICKKLFKIAFQIDISDEIHDFGNYIAHYAIGDSTEVTKSIKINDPNKWKSLLKEYIEKLKTLSRISERK